MKNGLTGGTQNLGTSVLGDIASLGIGLGAMGGMINMTKRCNVSSYEAVYCKWDKMYLIQFSNLGIAYVEIKEL